MVQQVVRGRDAVEHVRYERQLVLAPKLEPIQGRVRVERRPDHRFDRAFCPTAQLKKRGSITTEIRNTKYAPEFLIRMDTHAS
jgi:hypothetical protein